ncbi:hypothetical protein XENTR_v10005408 [Xenopus tropicalis]|nr:hypothetical protein XENTR_v10005408 [Xenopus tropicalis]
MSYKRTKCFHCRKDYNLKKSFGISKEPTIIVCKIKEDISSNNVTAVDKSEGENYVHEITQQNAISQHTKDSYLKRHGVLKDVKVVIHQLSKKDLADLDNINHKPDLLGGWIITKCSSCKNQGDKKMMKCERFTEEMKHKSLDNSCTPNRELAKTSFLDLCSTSHTSPVDLDESVREEKIQRLRESKRRQEEHLERVRRKMKNCPCLPTF